MAYHPLDYRTWILGDPAREGVNIKPLWVLSPLETELFNDAIPYQDQRNDPGQAEIVTLFAIRLLEEGMQGKRDVAVPAAILHDTGWYRQGDPDDWKRRVKEGLATGGEILRRPAQNRAVYLAGELLSSYSIPEETSFEIADIIGDHDTQLLPTTENGLVLRCADMLWRFTHPCMELYHKHNTPKESLAFMEGVSGYQKLAQNAAFRGGFPEESVDIAKRIARIELVNTMLWRYPKEERLLTLYQDEVDLVKAFYGE